MYKLSVAYRITFLDKTLYFQEKTGTKSQEALFMYVTISRWTPRKRVAKSVLTRHHMMENLNSFLASRDLCHWLITFANSLDPDQDRQNVGPDLDSNRLTL